MTACNACASRSAAFTMRNPTPGKSAASSPSKDCAASPSSTQGATVATCDQKRANRTRQISSATVTAPPPSPPSTDTPLRMHLTIHRTGGAGAPGDVRADGNAPQAIPCAPTGRLSWSVYRDRSERLSGTGSPLSPQRQRSSSRRELVGRAAMLRGRIITTTSLGANGALANCGRGGNPHATARPQGGQTYRGYLGLARRRRGAVAGSNRVAGARVNASAGAAARAQLSPGRQESAGWRSTPSWHCP